MKRLRRIAGLLLAMVMIFGLTATAFAAKVTNETGHTYRAYQIFSGTQQESAEDDTAKALGDIKWGSGIGEENGAALLGALKNDDRFKVDDVNIFADAESAADVAAALDGQANDGAIAKAFANMADKYKTGESTEIGAGESVEVELESGYYLIVDTTEGKPDAYNSALLQVTNGDIKITKKYDVPTVDKAVKETENGELLEAVDSNIGGTVYFVLKGTLPKNLDDYEKYLYWFNDTLSGGLKYKGDAKVYLFKDGNVNNEENGNKVEITSSFTITPAEKSDTDGGRLTVLTVEIADLKTIADVTADSAIVVEYSAELTGDVKTGSTGNPNTVKLEYSNNPNADGDGEPSKDTGETPEDKVIVFTYELDGTKIDAKDENKKLADAEFVLYRGKNGTEPGEDEGGNPTNAEYALISDGKLTGWTESRETAVAESNLLKSEAETGEFKVSGLDAGTYYLEEIKAPAGYNLLKAPVKLTIESTITNTENDADKAEKTTPVLTEVKIKTDGEDGTEQSQDGDTTEGKVSLVVKNNTGAVLPTTGGMGTTIFYVVGGLLVLAAGGMLIIKRRAKAEK